VVASTETLLRIFYVPHHVDENLNLRPEAISIDDIQRKLESTGRPRTLSVFRAKYVEPTSIDQLAANQMAKRPDQRKFAAIFSAEVVEIRAMVEPEGQRLLCVLDDALENEPSHAGVVSPVKIGRAQAKGLRLRLIDRFNYQKHIDTVA
jgi:hypothetical protein